MVQTASPVLLAHGGADAMVPVGEAHEIRARRPGKPVKLLLMPGSHDQYAEIRQHLARRIEFLDAARSGAGEHRPT